MKRNRGVDIFRTGALLLVLIYHAWVVCGQQPINNPIVSTVVVLGGEIGVTAFFALSGFGLYYSLCSMERTNSLSFKEHMKKRMIRVAPQYYLNLIVMLLFGDATVYLCKEHFSNILTHIFFIHNIFPGHHGAINGVLWTMGVIFQFYLIVIVLYKLMKKSPTVFWLVSIVVTIVMKYISFEYIVPTLVADSSYNFILGRQLFTALDNFTTGMYVAYLTTKVKPFNKQSIIGSIGVVVGVIAVIFVCNFGLQNGIHTNNFSGYIWHSGIAITLGIVMLGFSMIVLPEKSLIVKAIIWVSEIEYGTYLWHLPMFYNLVASSGWIVSLIAIGQRKYAILILVIVAILVGALFTKVTDAFMEKILNKRKEIVA